MLTTTQSLLGRKEGGQFRARCSWRVSWWHSGCAPLTEKVPSEHSTVGGDGRGRGSTMGSWRKGALLLKQDWRVRLGGSSRAAVAGVVARVVWSE